MNELLKYFNEKIDPGLLGVPDIVGQHFTYYKPTSNAVNPRVCLVAHIDTVYKCTDIAPTVEILHGLMVIHRNSTGLGADDRAGVYACMKLRAQTGSAVLLTDLEERGGVGAKEASNALKDYFQENIGYFIEMDRAGRNDMVFYNNEPRRFVKFIKKFGFKEAHGSYSDIASIGIITGIAGVNISTGYFMQHTKNEFLIPEILEENIERVAAIINARNGKQYKIPKRVVYEWPELPTRRRPVMPYEYLNRGYTPEQEQEWLAYEDGYFKSLEAAHHQPDFDEAMIAREEERYYMDRFI